MEEGLIRKIVVGKEPKDGMAYYIGMRAGKGEVSAILEDDRHLHKFGKKKIPHLYRERRRHYALEEYR